MAAIIWHLQSSLPTVVGHYGEHYFAIVVRVHTERIDLTALSKVVGKHSSWIQTALPPRCTSTSPLNGQNIRDLVASTRMAIFTYYPIRKCTFSCTWIKTCLGCMKWADQVAATIQHWGGELTSMCKHASNFSIGGQFHIKISFNLPCFFPKVLPATITRFHSGRLDSHPSNLLFFWTSKSQYCSSILNPQSSPPTTLDLPLYLTRLLNNITEPKIPWAWSPNVCCSQTSHIGLTPPQPRKKTPLYTNVDGLSECQEYLRNFKDHALTPYGIGPYYTHAIQIPRWHIISIWKVHKQPQERTPLSSRSTQNLPVDTELRTPRLFSSSPNSSTSTECTNHNSSKWHNRDDSKMTHPPTASCELLTT